MGFGFEWTVKLGDLLTVAGALFVAAAFLHKRGGQEAGVQVTLEALTIQLSEMKAEIKKIGEVLINQADQNRRIIHLEDDLRELRHGRGFVRGPDGIEREYP